MDIERPHVFTITGTNGCTLVMNVVKDGYLSLLVAVRLTIDKQFGFVRGIYPQQTSLQHASVGQNEVYLTLKGDHIALCLAFHHIPTTFQRFIIVVPITRKLSTVVTRLRLGLHLLAGTVPGTFQVGDLSLSRQHREQTDQTTGGKQISSLHLTSYLLFLTSHLLPLTSYITAPSPHSRCAA